MTDDHGAPLNRRLMISAVLVLVVVVGTILIVVGIANGGDSETSGLGYPSVA